MGIPRVRTSVVCVHNGQLLAVRLEDRVSGRVFLAVPGGKIEADETAPEAGERETLEETGFVVKVDETSGVDKEYVFTWEGEDYDCLTLFYRAHLASPVQRSVSDAPYHRGVVWVPMAEVRRQFAEHPVILEAMLELLADEGA